MAIIKERAETSGFATLSGTPAQMREQLNGLGKEGRVVVLTFDRNTEDAKARAIAETMMNVAPLVSDILARRERGALASIVEALVPSIAPPKHLLTEARMLTAARKAVIKGGDWLTAAEVAELAGFSLANPSTQPNKWKKDGLIFAIRQGNTDYFPAYGLDPDAGYRPRKALHDVLATFGEAKDGWGLAYWFASQNSFLGGQRPQDLLARDPARVIAAAQDEMGGIAHG